MVLDKGDFTVLVSHLSFVQNKNDCYKFVVYCKRGNFRVGVIFA